MAALKEYLSDTEIETLCRRLGHRWRQRTLGPGITVRSMVYRGLHPDQSIRATLADLTAGDDRLEQPPADASWCEARDRLPKALLPELLDASVRDSGDTILIVWADQGTELKDATQAHPPAARFLRPIARPREARALRPPGRPRTASL